MPIAPRRTQAEVDRAKQRTRRELESATGIEAMVCGDIAARQAVGIRKYGTTLADSKLSLRQSLWHAYEESLDLPIYLRTAIAKLDAETSVPSEVSPK